MTEPTQSPDAPQLRWQGVLLRLLLFVAIGWTTMHIIPFLLYSLAGQFVTAVLTSFGSSLAANAIVVRIYERGRLSDIGLGWSHGSSRQLGVGLGLGIVAALSVTALPLATRAANLVSAPAPQHPLASLALVSALLLFGAFGEETLFHGYAFQLLVRSAGPWAAVLSVGVLFGFAHADNLNASPFALVNTALWGILLGFAYLRTRALWLPIGLHFGWNVTLPLFGENLSGFTMGVTGVSLHWNVSELWSGGAYGPEGGLLTTIAGVVLFYALSRRFVLGRLDERKA